MNLDGGEAFTLGVARSEVDGDTSLKAMMYSCAACFGPSLDIALSNIRRSSSVSTALSAVVSATSHSAS